MDNRNTTRVTPRNLVKTDEKKSLFTTRPYEVYLKTRETMTNLFNLNKDFCDYFEERDLFNFPYDLNTEILADIYGERNSVSENCSENYSANTAEKEINVPRFSQTNKENGEIFYNIDDIFTQNNEFMENLGLQLYSFPQHMSEEWFEYLYLVSQVQLDQCIYYLVLSTNFPNI